MDSILFCLASYLMGSIPFGLILGKGIWGVDLRKHGSGNIGATNAWRTIGKQAGFTIFLLDMLKGAIPTYIGLNVLGSPLMGIICGVLAILGHSCSLFLGFKGGKSVSTGLGVIISLMPIPSLIVFLCFLAIVKVTGYVSLGSCVCAALVPILAFAFGYGFELIIFGILAAVFIIYRHKSNIQRLMNGTESKIKAAK